MTDNQREIAETVFERNQRRETEINNALKQEYARREAAVKNMYRLRALRNRTQTNSKQTTNNKQITRKGHFCRASYRHRLRGQRPWLTVDFQCWAPSS
jgi:hypothetical protein